MFHLRIRIRFSYVLSYFRRKKKGEYSQYIACFFSILFKYHIKTTIYWYRSSFRFVSTRCWLVNKLVQTLVVYRTSKWNHSSFKTQESTFFSLLRILKSQLYPLWISIGLRKKSARKFFLPRPKHNLNLLE